MDFYNIYNNKFKKYNSTNLLIIIVYYFIVINMKKRFKNKKNKSKLSKLLLIVFITILFFNVKKNYNSPKITLNKSNIIKYLIHNSNEITKDISNLDSSDFIFRYSLGYSKSNTKIENESNSIGDYLEDPDPSLQNDEPVVYIYNTHQTESYNKNVIEEYNISPTVMMSSYILRERLVSLSIPTVVETNNISSILNSKGWLYKDSYKASRLFLDEAASKYPSLKMFIDIHRDSSNYNNTTYNDGNVSYAKVLFVVGLDYEGYEDNLGKAETLNNILKEKKPELSRGIYKKSGKRVNGIYNQNFRSNTFLIEVGGQYNNIEEVEHTMKYLAESISSYVKENIYEKKA